MPWLRFGQRGIDALDRVAVHTFRTLLHDV